MSDFLGGAEYSIAAVSKLTGVSCHTLRVWERRYGYPVPNRSASGHRRYTHEQVGVLRNLANLARSGHSIGELMSDFLAGRLDLRAPDVEKFAEDPSSARVVDRLFEGDLIDAEETLDRLSENLSMLELVERVIEPALIDVGERWFRGECDIYQERYAVGILYTRLWRLLDRARRDNLNPSRSVLVGAVQGDRHEGGVLMLSLAMELAGCRAVRLSVDVPIREYQKAIEKWRPDALALSFVLSRNINKRFQELKEIRDVPVFVGGRSIVNHQGLARRYGLIPLTGSLSSSSSLLISQLEAWEVGRDRDSNRSGASEKNNANR